ncbi:MAG: hypothetical protein JO033_12695 [Acidobacteriaceae bacterium]|nr:hypothetical protein [Acidobacteriaceae bacterium]MBV9498826.1 hypothetical protein [Acidobacteriaceae bacterium]
MTQETSLGRKLSTVASLILFAISAVALPATIRANPEIRSNTNNPFSACGTFSLQTQQQAFKLIKSEACNELNLIVTGVHSGNDIGPDIVTLFTDLQTQLSLTPLCAASLIGVFAQRLVTAQVSAASCPTLN